MGETHWTPEAFARLMSLPADHPERKAAEADPAFDAWVRMAEAFESPAGGLLDEQAMRPVRAELSARIERELGARTAARAPKRIFAWAWFGAPAGRMALAFAALAVVSALGWWMTMRREEGSMVRGGVTTTSAPTLFEPRAGAGVLALEWSAAAGADGYRLVFYSADLIELARIDSLSGPQATLRAGELPAGLASGAEVTLEVVALAHGDPVSRSRLKPITLP